MAAADCTGGRTGPLRYAQYLAQVRHETDSLTTLHQPLDNGAGSLHMIPRQWVTAIDSVPRLKEAWAKESEPGRRFHGISRQMMVDIETNKTLERYVGLWLQNPELAFVYGGWWYPYGAAILEEPQCGDLRKQADVGQGAWDKKHNVSTGFWEVSRCIFGDLYDDWGLQDRIKAWDATYAVVKGWGGVQGVDGVGLGAGAVAGIVVGGLVFVCVVVVFVSRLFSSPDWTTSKEDKRSRPDEP
ncbi:hypothetical protein BCR44DRAFT_34367 [Catenaria anguillulae PL171]|uniref:Uncharacterized protein n=1 Tax=Catenaria anguillulae PL171 TaxID=765915 RepID=A0A1Y2HKQ5_9FUNG|nr:hypothetical protein BCR44DRAFT_34367 [Catenaria anguillulae PL171]